MEVRKDSALAQRRFIFSIPTGGSSRSNGKRHSVAVVGRKGVGLFVEGCGSDDGGVAVVVLISRDCGKRKS